MSRKTFEDRKLSAENTALWMMADVHRSAGDGSKTATVKVSDLVEVLSYIASIKNREKVEFQGKLLGYCRPNELRKLLNHECGGIWIGCRRGTQRNTPVFFTDIGEVYEPEETPVVDTVEIVEDSPC